MPTRYVKPTGTSNVFNDLVGRLAGLGVSVLGTRLLAVRGRKSGEWRTNPVNLLTVDGRRYLVAPRGQTQWVRNLRAAGTGELRLGRRTEVFVPTELADADKPPVLREYVRRWKFEVKMWFDGIDETSTDEELLASAPGFPVFRL